MESVRTELRGLLLRAMELQSEALLAMGDPGRAAEVAEATLALEPFREGAHRLLIAAHAAGGSRGEALRAYERCRRALAEELGVPPSAETEAAYLALLGDEPGDEARRADAPEAPVTVPTPLLPTQPRRRLVGRDPEQASLRGAWRRAAAGRRQLVLLAGEAGIGKTALALDLAAAAEAEAEGEGAGAAPAAPSPTSPMRRMSTERSPSSGARR